MTELAKSPFATKSPGRPPKKNATVEETEIQTEGNEVLDNNIDLGFELEPEKVYVFEVIKKSEALRIENLGSRCKIYDPTLKRYRELRYVAVAPTIFYEDQHESYDDYPDEPLMFNRNVLHVKGSNRRLMEYLLIHDLCEGSPFKISNKPAMYRLLDKEADDQKAAKRHKTEMEALVSIENMDFENLRPIARIIFGITETTETAVRNAMYDLAKKDRKGMEKSNAEKILDNLINPRLIRKYYIQTAIDTGILSVNKEKNILTFVEGGAVVCNINTVFPSKIVDEICDYSFTNDGQKFYSTLRAKL